MAKILLVEDDEASAAVVYEWLSDEHYTVEMVDDGLEALERLRIGDYDLVLLDWDLPGMAGYEVCRQFRSEGGLTPIIMVTGKSTFTDKIAGLEVGADDYVTKPFNLAELSARIKARLRNAAGVASNILKANGITLDPTNYICKKDGADIDLLPKEIALLEFFMRNPNKVFSGEAILRRVWHTDSEATDNALRGTLKRLRAKIDSGDDSMIETVH